MTSAFDDEVLTAAKSYFRFVKRLVDDAVAQLSERQLHFALDGETNCIAVNMKHLAATFRSRWTDFLTTDGEKPWRDREDEFTDSLAGQDLAADWEDGWSRLFAALDELDGSQLTDRVAIRNQPLAVHESIVRSLVHASVHAGQILLLAKHLAGEPWRPVWTAATPRQ
ncbi:MAG: DinB family protein [Pirellulaceae bacterium]|jgi:hypothetical protein|nr:DinB family protein [Pirellulaceae bacterium]MDP7017860.1 DinB family protein [Pirellulaceae bacterium]